MTTPTAKHVEGLISMHQDLRRVMQLTYSAVELIKNLSSDKDLLQTYWSEALNIYARPFKDGVRQFKLNPDIFKGIEGASETHKYFVDQRDKLIAHSVNPFESIYVGVLVDAAGKVVGVGELAGKLVATSQEGFQNLNQLAKIATEYLKHEIVEHKKQLLKEASQMPVEAVQRLKVIRFTAPGPDQASKIR